MTRRDAGTMNVVCIGSGYVGSVTGVAFAVLGHPTTIIDIDENKVNMIKSGKSPIYEPGLDDLIQKNIGHTLFVTSSYEAVSHADVVFIGVGTPSKPDGTADLKYIRAAARSVGENLSRDSYTVVVNKSTVPIGTADLVASIIEEESGLVAEQDFSVISNPEFLREGYALEDVFFPDRIVIGTENPRARMVMKDLYANLIERTYYDAISQDFAFEYHFRMDKPYYFETDTKSAEMIKYASNAFLAVKISYINEVARLCESLGANVLDVSKGMGLDSRIGAKFLQVSSGWSGSCFPKDTAEFLATSLKYGMELSSVKAAIESNNKMHSYCVEKIRRQLKTLVGKNVGIMGLTFKPNTDDARKTQATGIITELLDLGASIKVHDPQGMEMFRELNGDLQIQYCNRVEEVAVNADALVLLTHWQEYLDINWNQVQLSMRIPYILDTRNFLPGDTLTEIGFTYEGLGVSSHRASKYWIGVN